MANLNAAMDCDAFRAATDAPVDGTCQFCYAGLVRNTAKNGVNAGRIFISCPNSKQGVAGCGFVRWLDTRPGEHVKQTSLTLRCKTCSRALESGQVNKEGPNKGQIFWTCPFQCPNNFVWDKPTAIVKEAKVGKAEHEAALKRIADLEAKLFVLHNHVQALIAFTKMPTLNVQAPLPF